MALQLLKLGVVEGLPDISEYYVIWDMDMIATRPLPIFFRADEGDRDARAQLGFPTSSQAELMHPLRTRVNIGGAWPVGYRLSYQHLFGEECAFPCCTEPRRVPEPHCVPSCSSRHVCSTHCIIFEAAGDCFTTGLSKVAGLDHSHHQIEPHLPCLATYLSSKVFLHCTAEPCAEPCG